MIQLVAIIAAVACRIAENAFAERLAGAQVTTTEFRFVVQAIGIVQITHFAFIATDGVMLLRKVLVLVHLLVVLVHRVIIPAPPQGCFERQVDHPTGIRERGTAHIKLARTRNHKREEHRLARTLVTAPHLVDAVHLGDLDGAKQLAAHAAGGGHFCDNRGTGKGGKRIALFGLFNRRIDSGLFLGCIIYDRRIGCRGRINHRRIGDSSQSRIGTGDDRGTGFRAARQPFGRFRDICAARRGHFGRYSDLNAAGACDLRAT